MKTHFKPKVAFSSALCIIFVVSIPCVTPFSPSPKLLSIKGNSLPERKNDLCSRKNLPSQNRSSQSKLHLSLSPVASVSSAIVGKVTNVIPPGARKTMLLGFVVLLFLQRKRILYPGAIPDLSFAEPLPPGKIGGCPFVGDTRFFNGINLSVSNRARSIGKSSIGKSNPSMFKLFGFSTPMIVVAGTSKIKEVLKNEFGGGVGQYVDYGLDGKFLEVIIGSESLVYESEDGKKYNYLRHMIGQALTPQKVTESIPILQTIAEEFVDGMLELKEEKLAMRDLMVDQSLHVACKQIIGLDFESQTDYVVFKNDVKNWLHGLSNFLYYILPLPVALLKRTRFYKAKKSIEQVIDKRIQQIKKNGPDGSTLSSMVLAIDDEANDGESKHLTVQQIKDNVFVLISAGSDTTSMTLTNTLFFLGMNPDMWNKVVSEQDAMIAKHGHILTKDRLEHDCSYLDSVIKESMRLITVSGGLFRKVDNTLVVDGQQIPKNWMADLSLSLTHEYDEKTWKEDRSHMDVKLGFKPERWLDKGTKPSEYIPYGVGRRYCLGKSLAATNMLIFLSVLARNVRSLELFTDIDNLKWKEGLIITPKDGVIMKLHPKDK